jgi:phosphoribosyl 1,2-cyclic phosphodiesterase
MSIKVNVLGSGSAGNATCIEGGGARVLLDAGFSCRELRSRLEAVGVAPHRIDALVITHEHTDHVQGAAVFSRTFKVPIHCTAATAHAAGLDRQKIHARRDIHAGRPFAFGELRFEPFSVPHDAVETLGYTVECGGTRVGYATDLGHAGEAAIRGLRDCDLLILEANHDVAMLRSGPYPYHVKQRVLGRHGHLDNESSAGLACEVTSRRTRRIVLAHLSRTNNHPDLASGAARRRFEREGRRAPLLHAARQEAPSPWFET